MLGIYEDTFGASEVGAGTYLIIAAVALMVLRSAPAFFREVLSNVRIWPVLAGCVAFWWLLLSGRPWFAAAALFAGLIAMNLLPPASPTPKAAPDEAEDRKEG
jgi:hypothetical protein